MLLQNALSGSLRSQFSVTTLEKGITILYMLRLDLASERASEFAFSSSLGIGNAICAYCKRGWQTKLFQSHLITTESESNEKRQSSLPN